MNSLALKMIYSCIKHLLICISISVSFKAEALAEPVNAKVTGLYMEHSRGERDVCAGGGWLKAERLMEIQLPGTRTWDVTDHKMIMKIIKKHFWNFWLKVSVLASAQLFI